MNSEFQTFTPGDGLPMDLPTCPACGQSVLDDDAAECPFCGSSMKPGGAAKPVSKAAPAATKAPLKAATPDASPRPAAGQAARNAPRPEAKKSDDPFDVDASAGAGAVPITAKASKQRTVEITCPMCEAQGFIPSSAAGQDVKCYNPKCIAPVFKAPKIKVVEAVAPPPKPKQSFVIVGATAGGALILGGFLVYWFVFAPKVPDFLPPAPPISPQVGEQAGGDKTAGEKTGVDNGSKVATPDDPDKTLSAKSEASRTQRLHSLIESAREAKTLKAYCRRLSAAGSATAGDLVAAREQLKQLKSAEADTVDDAIVPLVAIAWRQLATDDAEAKQTIEDALTRATSLEPRGWYRAEAVIELAAVLAAVGRAEEGRTVLARGSAGPQFDAMIAALETVRADHSFDLDQPLVGRTVGGWRNPLDVGVTLVLCGKGRFDEALAWAKGLPDDGPRSECLVCWGTAFARKALAAKGPLDKLTALQTELPAGANARLLAQLADLQLQSGDQVAATASLAAAKKSLEGVTVPPLVKLTNLKSVLEVKLPKPSALELAAMAAVDIARIEVKLTQPAEAVWKDIQTALAILRGTAPTLAVVLDMQERARILPQVRMDLNINNDDLARRKQNECVAACKALQAAASERFRLETTVLLAAVDAGLLAEVRTEIESRASQSDPNERVNLILGSAVSGVLVARARLAGKQDLANEVVALLGDDYAPADNSPLIQESTAELGDLSSAIALLTSSRRVDGTLNEWSLRLACRLVRSGRHEDAVKLLASLNELLRIEGLRVAGALASKLGMAEQFELAALERFKTPPDRAALYAGLLDGTELPVK